MRITRLLSLLLLLLCQSGFGACLSNTLVTFEAAGLTNAQPITLALLTNSSVGESIGWTISDSENITFRTASQNPLLSAITLCTGGSQDGSGSFGFRTYMPTNTTWHDRVRIIPQGTTGFKASCGFWARHTIPNNNAGQFDWVAIYGTGGDAQMVVNAKLKDNGGPTAQTLSMECIGCNQGSDIFTGATILSNNWCWYALGYWSATNIPNQQIWVYDSNTNLLGTVANSNACTHIVTAGPILLGLQQGQASLTGIAYIDIDNIIVDYSANPAWPPLPAGPPPTQSAGTTLTSTRLNVGTLKNQ